VRRIFISTPLLAGGGVERGSLEDECRARR
jgi:hypothetical protein